MVRFRSYFLWGFITLIAMMAGVVLTLQGKPEPEKPKRKMKVEIWSDVMCPFCYIGKRRFEAALAKFEHKEQIQVVWKSFQLQPNMKTDPSKRVVEHLAESKGWSLQQAEEANTYVTQMAKEVGLDYHLEKAVGCQFIRCTSPVTLRQAKGKGDAMEEQLFKAYFTDGKNTADHPTLTALAVAIGLNESEVLNVLATDAYANDVRQDIYESQQIGVSGVPFFVFNNKYAVSGAQATETFLGALQKAWSELAPADTLKGAACKPDGSCD